MASGSARQGPITPRCPVGSVKAFWTEKAVNLTHDVRRRCGDWTKVVKLWEVDFVRRESGGPEPAEKVFVWAHDEDCVGVCWERIREMADGDLNSHISGPDGGVFNLDDPPSAVKTGPQENSDG